MFSDALARPTRTLAGRRYYDLLTSSADVENPTSHVGAAHQLVRLRRRMAKAELSDKHKAAAPNGISAATSTPQRAVMLL
jgi:hypothetical protein